METTFGLLCTLGKALTDLGKPKHILVAFSAGADSTALLHLLKTLHPKFGFGLTAVHIHHGLRTASDMEEAVAICLAKHMDIPLIIKKVKVRTNGNLEDAARKARYRAFSEAMEESGADVIALAHHADDQAETMLMRLLSGCGLEGLSGMRTFYPPYWRPLLKVSKTALLDYLKENALEWVEDESNEDTAFTRNFLRHEIIPLLEERQPGLSLRLSNTADILMEDNAILVEMEGQWLSLNEKRTPPFHHVPLSALSMLSVGMRRRILRRVCAPYGLTLNYSQTLNFEAFIENPTLSTFNLSTGLYAYKSIQRLHILNDDVKLSDVYWSQPEVKKGGSGFGDGRHEQLLDARAVKGAVMRCPMAGDVIQPKGMKGTQTLNKYFSARGMDLPFRAYWPILAKGNRVLWVPGQGIAEEAKVKAGETKVVRFVFGDVLPDER